MALRFVLDENLRGQLWRATQRHNALGLNPIDVTRVGDPPDLPLGATDSDILIWAERAGRVIVSNDRTTLPSHFWSHIQSGNHSPGLFLIRPRSTISQIIYHLVLAAYAADPAQLRDQIEWIP
jgi:Domain of unknown function (DUF5615)